jgi:hypothetical protein
MEMSILYVPLFHVAYLAMKVLVARLLCANRVKDMKVPVARLHCAKGVRAMKVPLVLLLNANIVKERRKNSRMPMILQGYKTWMGRLVHLVCLSHFSLMFHSGEGYTVH